MMDTSVWLRFYGDLNDLVAPERRGRSSPLVLRQPTSARDAIERLGVPHPEVGMLLVDGESVALSFRLAGGERVSVYPHFSVLDVRSVQRVECCVPARVPRFVADGHLGTLARLLRMLGLDTVCERDLDDAAIARIGHEQERIVLTRDRGLLKRSAVEFGQLVRSTRPDEQVREVLQRFRPEGAIQPLSRCLLCNAALVPVSGREVGATLLPGTRQHYDSFRRCNGCGKVYWEGSHVVHMRSRIANLLTALDDVSVDRSL